MRTKNIFASILLAVQAAQATASGSWDDMNSLEFVYNISRHGARSLAVLVDLSIFGVDMSQFTVELGELTPLGMRQRYLKGCLNRVRYRDEYQLLSEDYSPGELYVQSSHKSRTI